MAVAAKEARLKKGDAVRSKRVAAREAKRGDAVRSKGLAPRKARRA